MQFVCAHLNQQLVQRAFSLTVAACCTTAAASLTNRINLINVDDGWCIGACILKQLSHTCWTNT